jgi:hypothetical protein
MTPVSDRQHDAFDNQHKEVRYLDIHEDDQLDEAQLAGAVARPEVLQEYLRACHPARIAIPARCNMLTGPICILTIFGQWRKP